MHYIDINSLLARIRAIDWHRVLDRQTLIVYVRGVGWKRLLFLVAFIPSMVHILGTVSLPEYSALKLAPPQKDQSIVDQEELQHQELQNLISMPGFESLGLEPEEIYIRSTKKEVIMNPLIKYLLEYSPGQLKYSIVRNIVKIEAYDAAVLEFYTAAAILMLLSIAVLSMTGHSWTVMPFVKAGLNIGRFIIFCTVFLTPLLWFIFDYNLMGRMNGIFLKGPLYFYISATMSLKIYDLNNQVVERLVLPFTSLTLSAAIVYFF